MSVHVIRKCVECRKERRLELERLKHGWLCVRCARTKVFREANKKGGAR